MNLIKALENKEIKLPDVMTSHQSWPEGDAKTITFFLKLLELMEEFGVSFKFTDIHYEDENSKETVVKEYILETPNGWYTIEELDDILNFDWRDSFFDETADYTSVIGFEVEGRLYTFKYIEDPFENFRRINKF
jgi:hypothetical protein